MIHITPKEHIVAYYQHPALGQSKLKRLIGDIGNFNKEEDSDKEHFILGSAVDVQLTGYPGQFENEFYVSDLQNTPSDAVIGIIKKVYERVLEDYTEYLTVVDPVKFQEDHFVVEQSLEPVETQTMVDFAPTLGAYGDYILEACAMAEYQPNYKPETKINAILKGGSKDDTMIGDLYFQDLTRSFGKKVINGTQNSTVSTVVNSLKTNPRTARFFDRQSVEDLSHIDFYYQLPIYFTYKGTTCKALLDMAIVVKDYEGEIVSVQGIDLKTCYGNTFDFDNHLRKRRYDIQAAWYTMALGQYFNLIQSGQLDLIDNFIFVVESTTSPGKPLAFTVTDSLLDMGKNGRRAISIVDTDLLEANRDVAAVQLYRPILGYDTLVDKFLYHQENGFYLEKEIAQQPVETPLSLDWDGIVTPLLD